MYKFDHESCTMNIDYSRFSLEVDDYDFLVERNVVRTVIDNKVTIKPVIEELDGGIYMSEFWNLKIRGNKKKILAEIEKLGIQI